jgi:uncharacterized membrane protein YkoI
MPLFRLHSVLEPQGPAMRVVLLILIWWGVMGAAHAQGAAALRNCLAPREMQEIVSTNGVVAPASAVMTAQRQVPNADVVRANLCRSDNALVYVIMALRKDGRVVQVMIDAPSGRIRSVQ